MSGSYGNGIEEKACGWEHDRSTEGLEKTDSSSADGSSGEDGRSDGSGEVRG